MSHSWRPTLIFLVCLTQLHVMRLAAVDMMKAEGGGGVTFNLGPPKIGSPQTNFSEIFGPTLKNLFPYV